ncbi:hypothetical protein KA005_33540, partial [bacterium]|nr:hypothetical protein [bacterium]
MILLKNIVVLKIGLWTLVFTAFSRPIITILEGATPLPLHMIIPAVLLYLLLLMLICLFSSINWNTVGFLII